MGLPAYLQKFKTGKIFKTIISLQFCGPLFTGLLTFSKEQGTQAGTAN